MHNSAEVVQKQVQELIENENLMLQALGLNLNVHHPHMYISNIYGQQVGMIMRSEEDGFTQKQKILDAQKLHRRAWHIATFTLLQGPNSIEKNLA